jgi:hypothetical protein
MKPSSVRLAKHPKFEKSVEVGVAWIHDDFGCLNLKLHKEDFDSPYGLKVALTPYAESVVKGECFINISPPKGFRFALVAENG